MGLLPMSAGEEPSATSASRLRDSFLSSPASLPAAREVQSLRRVSRPNMPQQEDLVPAPRCTAFQMTR